MLQLFKSGKAESYFILLLIGLLAWYPAFKEMSLIEIPTKQMIIYGSLVTIFSKSKFLLFTSAVLAAFAGALLVNAISNNFEMRTKANLFPALIYLLFVALFPHNHRLNPALIGNLFILGSWWLVFDTYREEKSNGKIFLSGLLISLGSLVYFPILIHFIILLISISILRPFKWREWTIALIGLLLPFIYLFSYYYFTNRLIEKFEYVFIKDFWNWQWQLQFTNSNIIFLIVAGIFFLLSLFVHFGLMSTGKIKTQKYLTIIFFNLLVSAAIVVIAQNWSSSANALLALPLAFMLGNFFMQIKSSFIGEICFWLLILSVAIVKTQLLATLQI